MTLTTSTSAARDPTAAHLRVPERMLLVARFARRRGRGGDETRRVDGLHVHPLHGELAHHLLHRRLLRLTDLCPLGRVTPGRRLGRGGGGLGRRDHAGRAGRGLVSEEVREDLRRLLVVVVAVRDGGVADVRIFDRLVVLLRRHGSKRSCPVQGGLLLADVGGGDRYNSVRLAWADD